RKTFSSKRKTVDQEACLLMTHTGPVQLLFREDEEQLLGKVAQTACMSACKHISTSLMQLLLNPEVRQISIGALHQLNVDLKECERAQGALWNNQIKAQRAHHLPKPHPCCSSPSFFPHPPPPVSLI
ncbi:hypothetical protein CRENBAI_003092, partial [Crenichthys baileyi]